MHSWLDTTRGPLTQSVFGALRENAAHNRSGLPPFRLPQVAKQIISGLIEFEKHADVAAVGALGADLGRQGLGLHSLLATSKGLLRDALSFLRTTPEAGTEQIVAFQDFMAALIEALAAWEMLEVRRQRDEMQLALERAVQTRESELRRLIQKLSTPLIPVYDKVLVVPLIAELDDERAQKLTESLLAAVVERQARIAILDITGVPSMDARVAAALVRTAKAVQLLGARVVLVGIRPEMAQALVQLGVELSGMATLANLQSAIEYALRERGLVVRPQAPASTALRSPSRSREAP